MMMERKDVQLVDIELARKIYANPKGYSKQQLRDCIVTMNEHTMPECNALQFEAIKDAHRILGIGSYKV